MGTLISLPNGRTVEASTLVQYRVRPRNAREFLERPEILLKNPKKSGHYGWPLRDPRTDGLIRGGLYRRVRPSELRSDTPYEVYTQEGTGGIDSSGESGQVEWFNHLLVEISEEYWKDYIEAPAWQNSLILAERSEAFEREAQEVVPGVSAKTNLTEKHTRVT